VLATARVRRTSAPTSLAQGDGEELRRVVLEAVQRMSIAEIRELRLPIGIVFDVLASLKSR
jgi:hypothetical protein